MLMLGSLLAGGASAGLGFLSNYLNGLMNTGFQKELQANQARLNYEYAEKSARNTPTWNRAGLESAGYNPMLAVQNATSGANSSWASGGTATTGTEDISSAIANAQSYKRLDNETKTAESTVKANEATAEYQSAEAANKRAENPFIPDKMRAEIKKLDSDSAYVDALKQNLKDRLELDQYLGESGLAVQMRGQDKSYNASTYASNVNAQTQRGIKTFHTGFGTGYSGYVDKDTFSSKPRPTSKTHNTGKSYHWEHY